MKVWVVMDAVDSWGSPEARGVYTSKEAAEFALVGDKRKLLKFLNTDFESGDFNDDYLDEEDESYNLHDAYDLLPGSDQAIVHRIMYLTISETKLHGLPETN